jgi:hypothetical protein
LVIILAAHSISRRALVRELEQAIANDQVDLTVALLRVFASQAHFCDAQDCASCVIAPASCNLGLDEAARVEIFNRAKARMEKGQLVAAPQECWGWGGAPGQA